MKNQKQNQLNDRVQALQGWEPLVSLPLLQWILNYCIWNATHGAEAFCE